MIVRRWLVLGAFVAILLGCSAQPASLPAQPVRAVSPAGLALVPLEIRSRNKAHHFTVEVAASPDEQSRGLMFRPKLAPDKGMIFPFAAPRIAAFWMHDCTVPLDMVFIRPNGTIARIAVNTTPYSDDPISSYEPVAAVLELAGGRTVELGIGENDRVTWHLP